ncbi:MAG: hypothetical protein AB7F50_07275 [Fimbriimonadaceae bacterium]
MHFFLNTLAQFDSQEYMPSTLFGIVLLPTALAIGAFVYFLRGEFKGWPKSLKWTALLPLILGVILGIGPFNAMNDELYRDQYGSGPRARMLHYGGVVLPILTAVGLVVVGMLRDKQRVDEF